MNKIIYKQIRVPLKEKNYTLQKISINYSKITKKQYLATQCLELENNIMFPSFWFLCNTESVSFISRQFLFKYKNYLLKKCTLQRTGMSLTVCQIRVVHCPRIVRTSDGYRELRLSSLPSYSIKLRRVTRIKKIKKSNRKKNKRIKWNYYLQSRCVVMFFLYSI